MSNSKFSINIQSSTGAVVVGDGSSITVHHGQSRVETLAGSDRVPVEQQESPSVTGGVHCQETGEPISSERETEEFTRTIKNGYVLIINNQTFPQRKKVERSGSAEDVQNLKSLFDDFGLHPVKVVKNLTSTQILETLVETSEKDFSKYDCFICVILSHGSTDGIFGVDEQVVQVEALTSKFRRSPCPSLENKPKLFFIQACRGSNQDIVPVESDSEPVPMQCRGLPSDADFLICYASSPGYESYRHPDRGSWFIRSLVEVFKEYAPKEHIMDMMLRVNSRVSSFYSNHGHKQMPSEICMLTKKFFFNPPS